MENLAQILSHFPIPEIERIESLDGAGGFSGAKFWRITTSDSILCLRRWPKEHPTRDRLNWLHQILEQAGRSGCSYLPIPMSTRTGDSYVERDGHFWELSPWLPGVADFHANPTPERLDAALIALAEFHVATESMGARTEFAPGITSRLEQLERLDHPAIDKMTQAVAALRWPEFQQLASPLLHLFREHQASTLLLLQQAATLPVSIQPCIRDVWHDHVLFHGREVTGIVDFGAMQIDHVGCDISRLLGSLVADDRTGWDAGLAAYQSIRELTANDQQLIHAYDRGTVLLSGMNWVQWVAVEKRQFEQPARIIRRMQGIVERLREM